ncbi:bifunctional phosphoribosylaminoimidazolecarboxamide formyltransferase/IMP cyclohydrolase [Candidatus Aquiluna sp. UB-MaderosW2red]|jgi:phosphoribosylaminoimidazolecarboxamide formyltransferase/IMP cyclohydrolase|uniref:bifunctional phosphoribosylaminoimidazolecarboxamide formyltransferase/IMP cyclohydrolase n=1 Tax=Candidatus Aquiluna sp. UB-MaderosW2red TaxID=1855377 RepID=UPI000875C7B2|nr:bifunctional phosphoribosylaminoimidazolecarboxamide formyltransferase/IMP cyclohydrolase [Candidatus Aquiluna sp. UB-MaderosW2red]SCX07309.1 phosphoribosylaminoimidazolecarboxamide formyltransferase / IMP cyclohydrolase [Candidatus Aquiluna sp. UB-MaderosW2red]
MTNVRGADEFNHRDRIRPKRALISVSDKTGLIELVGALVSQGVKLVSTGSTAKQIAQAGYPVQEVSEVTGFPESLDGRVKTLHPKIHGGILADLRLKDHREELAGLGIEAFELVVVNLYPFVKTVAAGARGDEAIEQIDIGGPAMVRAAAKNHANVAIVVDPGHYSKLIAALNQGGTTLELRRELAGSAFTHTAQYDSAVANWFSKEFDSLRGEPGRSPGFESELNPSFDLSSVLRYGENSHQAAAIYNQRGAFAGIAQARQLSGKEMSYNNYVDADAALRCAYDFIEPAVAIIKHANPCGVAVSFEDSEDAIANAHLRAHQTDPVSAFGGVIAANRMVTKKMAEQVSEIFTEVIAAPSFEVEALTILSKKKNLRILELRGGYQRPKTELRQISGGLLVQESDGFEGLNSRDWVLVSGPALDDAGMLDLEFAWRACRAVKSNAILLAKAGAAVGIGMGQVNRLDSCRLAIARAGDRVIDSVAASDAFFPFADGLEVLIEAGVKAVVQPGGSVRDEEVIAAAKKAGISMYFTSERHFYH